MKPERERERGREGGREGEHVEDDDVNIVLFMRYQSAATYVALFRS